MIGQQRMKQFGFKGNPFDTKALTLNSKSLLPISKAFAGRAMDSPESKTISRILGLPGGNRFVVEGEVGVGKTTFVNYHRYLWEEESPDKLFTTIQEIPYNPNWDLKDFLLNVLGKLVQRLLKHRKGKNFAEEPLIREILILTKVYSSNSHDWQLSIMGSGGGRGRNEIITVPPLSESQLIYYFEELVEFIKSLGYVGVFLHIDNFDKVVAEDPKKIHHFFHLLRDTLQTSDVYFAFVGYPGFYRQIIYPIERVGSIFFQFPLLLPPLSQKEVIDIIERRYQILGLKKYIRPVSQDFIDYLYHLHQGKIRPILDSLSTLITSVPNDMIQTLSLKDAKQILSEELKIRLSSVLSESTFHVLSQIARESECTSSEIARKLRQHRQGVAPIFKELETLHLIYSTHREGRKIYYRINESLKILKDFSPYKKSQPLAALSPIQREFLLVLDQKGQLKLKEFCELKVLKSSRIRGQINDLVRNGILEKHGYTRAMYYMRSGV